MKMSVAKKIKLEIKDVHDFKRETNFFNEPNSNDNEVADLNLSFIKEEFTVSEDSVDVGNRQFVNNMKNDVHTENKLDVHNKLGSRVSYDDEALDHKSLKNLENFETSQNKTKYFEEDSVVEKSLSENKSNHLSLSFVKEEFTTSKDLVDVKTEINNTSDDSCCIIIDAEGEKNQNDKTDELQCKAKSHTAGTRKVNFLNYNLPGFRTECNDIIHICNFCEIVYSKREMMLDHLGNVHGDFHYFCSDCGDFMQNKILYLNHTTVFTFNCEYCEYGTNRYRTLFLHCQRKHNKTIQDWYAIPRNIPQQLFKCPTCGYSTSQQHHFDRHIAAIHKVLKNK